MIFKVDVRFFYAMAPELTVCRISAAFSYGFLLIPAGFQKVSFYVVKVIFQKTKAHVPQAEMISFEIITVSCQSG